MAALMESTLEQEDALPMRQEEESPEEESPVRPMNNEHRRQVVFLAFCFFLLFLGFSVAQNFQTSGDETVGSMTLFLVYLSFCLMCLFAPIIVGTFPPRRVLWVSSLAYVLFTASNISFHPALSYVSGVLCGVAAATLWTAQPYLLARHAEAHELKNGQPRSSALGLFNGTFFAIFMSANLVGNLLAAFLLQRRVPITSVFVVMTTICAAGSMGLLLLAPLSPMPHAAETTPLISMLTQTVRMARDGKMQRLVIVFVCMGGVKSLIFGDLPVLVPEPDLKFYAMSLVGGFSAGCSYVTGRLVKRFGEFRLYVWLFPAVFLICLSLALVLRHGPYPPLSFLFVAASVLGLSDGGISTTSNALVGRLFPDRKEPAFASMQLLISATNALFFMMHSQLTATGKCAVICALSIASLISLALLAKLLSKDTTNPVTTGRGSQLALRALPVCVESRICLSHCPCSGDSGCHRTIRGPLSEQLEAQDLGDPQQAMCP